jgi:hypothetical protein
VTYHKRNLSVTDICEYYLDVLSRCDEDSSNCIHVYPYNQLCPTWAASYELVFMEPAPKGHFAVDMPSQVASVSRCR